MTLLVIELMEPMESDTFQHQILLFVLFMFN